MSTRHIIILVLYVLFVNLFFFHPVGSLGAGLFLVGTLVATVLYFFPESVRLQRPAIVAGVATVLASLELVHRANEFIAFILFVGSMSIILSLFYLLVNKLDSFRAVSEFLLLVPITGWRYIKSVFPALKALGSNPDSEVVSQKIGRLPIKSLLLGLIVSFPVLLILIPLLSGADPIFKQTIEKVLSGEVIEKIVNHSVLSLVVFAVLLPLLNITYKPFRSPLRFLRSQNYGTEFSVVMTMVAAVLFLFVTLQWKYIFVPAVKGVNLSQFGFDTYSSYVQKGFTEFIAATLFVFSLLWIGLVALHGRGKKSYLLVVQLVVLGEFMIVLAAFFRRIWLYQYFHGMTLVRFYGGYFVAVIGLFALTLLGRHLWERRWITVELVIATAAIVGLGLFNVEQYIAVGHPPTVNERVDYTYLSRLSADGYVGWKKAYHWVNSVNDELATKVSNFSAEERRQHAYTGLVTQQLLSHYDELLEKYGTDDEKRQYYSLVLTQADELVRNRRAEIESLYPLLPDGTIVVMDDGLQLDKAAVAGSYTTNIDLLAKLQDSIALAKEELTKPWNEQQYHLVLHGDGSYYLSQKYSDIAARCTVFVMCRQNPSYSLQSPSRSIPMSWYSLVAGAPEFTDQNILTYNASEESAFKQMQEDMPIDKLVELQKSHFFIYEQIIKTSQTVEDRTFDADISLDSPFLKPVSHGYYY